MPTTEAALSIIHVLGNCLPFAVKKYEENILNTA